MKGSPAIPTPEPHGERSAFLTGRSPGLRLIALGEPSQALPSGITPRGSALTVAGPRRTHTGLPGTCKAQLRIADSSS